MVVALFPSLHALSLHISDLSLQVGQLGILDGLEFRLSCLFLEDHEFVLDLQHVEPVGHQEILLVVFQNHVKLVVQVFDCFVDASVDIGNPVLDFLTCCWGAFACKCVSFKLMTGRENLLIRFEAVLTMFVEFKAPWSVEAGTVGPGY